MHRRMPALTAAACTTVLLTAAIPAASASSASPSAAVAPGHYTGTVADGATWIADVPAHWNGTLILFSHGFGPTTAADAPSADSQTALLDQGYALAGSSYDPNGSWWALDTAAADQFATLSAVEQLLGVRPHRVISMGESMGGLINSQIAERGAGRVNAALNLCGLVGGGVNLNNYQLNAEYAITQLIPGASGVRIRDYSSPADGSAAAATMSTAITAAQSTAAGQARIALVGALLNETDWAAGEAAPAPHDYAGQEAQEEQWMTTGGQLGFIEFGRYYIEQAAGGDSGWNLGVNYAALLRGSVHFQQVAALYQAAGLNLSADLAALDRNESYAPEGGSLASMEQSSTNTGRLAVPLLDIHTTSDQLVPVEQESAYAEKVAEAGDSALLRQAYVSRQGHCDFTAAEIVAALDTVNQRAATGTWGDTTSAASLEARADALGLDGAAYVPFRPGRLVTQGTNSIFAVRSSKG
ncbi:MAG TPA: alpha/beta hydrolase [Actinospica sp.]|nr:alpha/beta hydrolase [Actinospica sp.]